MSKAGLGPAALLGGDPRPAGTPFVMESALLKGVSKGYRVLLSPELESVPSKFLPMDPSSALWNEAILHKPSGVAG